MASLSSRKDLVLKLKVLIVWRAAIITVFLGSLALLQLRGNLMSPGRGISLLVAGTYLLSVAYLLLLPRISWLVSFSYVQILVDLGIESGIIYLTGGIESPFSFLYILSIISASILLSRSGGYLSAALATILYGSLANLEFYQVIEPWVLYHRVGGPLEGQYFLHTVFLNVSAFFLVAFLSGHLAESLWKAGKELKERKVAWEALQAFHENIVKSIDSGLFTTGLDGRINSFNRAAERITGYPPQSVQGLLCHQLFPFMPAQERLIENLLRKTPMGLAPHRYEGSFLHQKGPEIFLGMNLSAFRDEQGTITGMIGVFQDITDRKEMEAQIRQADRLAVIGRVAARMAHEIRNPLASISGSIQLLRSELDLSDSNRRLMDIVITETERLNQLLTDFLNYARPHPPVFQPCDIHQILEETLLLLRNGRSPASSVEIVRSFHHGQGPSPRMDPFQIKQVFWNLCLNALQSMPSGGTLHLSTRQVGFHDLPRKLKAYWRSMGEAPRAIGGRQNEISTTHDPLSAADQAFLEVTIADTGPGISAEDQAKIFDPFYTTRDRGNGLGLAIVYRIIEEHHGFIHLESKPAQGTAFKVYLPI